MDQQQNEEQAFPELKVTEEIRSYLYEMTKWANFLAIVGFVIAGFLLIIAFTIGGAVKTNLQQAVVLGLLGNVKERALIIVFLIIYAFVILYPSMLLFKFSKQGKLGILYGEQEALNQSLAKIKSLFRYYGIIAIIFIVQSLLIALGTLFGKANY